MDQKQSETMASELLLRSFPELNLSQNILKQVDSLAMVDLILSIEEVFHIQVAASEMNDRNFADITALSNWLTIKVNKSASRQS